MKSLSKASESRNEIANCSSRDAEVLEQLASALSHDVRTPLRHTHHFLDFFERGLDQPLNDTSAENMRLIRQGLDTAASMVETLIEFARLGQKADGSRTLKLPDLLVEAMYLTRNSLNASDASLSVTGHGSVLGSHDLLLSLFAHLFDNCIMYMPEGQAARIAVSIQTTADKAQNLIIIEDNGTGFEGAPEAAFRMFQSGSRKVPGKGLGVGLPFARRIAELHGGSVRVSDTVSSLGGARLEVRLPSVEKA